MANNYKIVVFVPEFQADAVLEAMAAAGAGKIGNYTYCSFSSKGIGRFRPGQGAHPAIGEIGKSERVAEERIEMLATPDVVGNVLAAIRRAHPYEEPAIDVYPLADWGK